MTVKRRARGRRKRPLTQQDRMKWLSENARAVGAGRVPSIYKDSLTMISEDVLAGLTLAMYQILLTPPKGQENTVPNKRTIVLIVPYNYRALYGREFVMGRILGLTEDRWYCRLSVRVSRLYDYLYKKGLMSMPRSAFTAITLAVRLDLRMIERSLNDLIPTEVLEKFEGRLKEEEDKKNLQGDVDKANEYEAES